MPSRSRLIAALLLAFGLASPSSAQDWKGTYGRLEGKVLDAAGQPIPDASIKLELKGRGGTTVKADKKGKWAIAGITSGNWTVEAGAPGFVSKLIEVQLPAESARLAPIELRLDKAQEAGPPPEIMAALKSADEAFEARRFPEARQQYEKALADPKVAAQPDAAKALHIRIARCLSQEGQYAKELEHLNAVIASDPTNADIISLAAQEAIKGGLVAEGMALLAKLDATTQVKDPAVFFNVGVLLLNQSKQDEAIRYFTKSVEVDPSYVDGYLQRALAYLGQGKMAESKADFQKVVQLAPGTPQAETAKTALASIK